jgi:insertion element IS1 protein InsB
MLSEAVCKRLEALEETSEGIVKVESRIRGNVNVRFGGGLTPCLRVSRCLPHGKKGNQRWLWHAIDHHTGKVWAYVFGRRTDEVFLQLKTLLEPFGLTRYYTDYWGAYTRHLDPDVHSPGKQHTQKIERKHLTLRTRIKRLVRKTICFSKTTQMHDIVIGLFVNRYAFGLLV